MNFIVSKERKMKVVILSCCHTCSAFQKTVSSWGTVAFYPAFRVELCASCGHKLVDEALMKDRPPPSEVVRAALVSSVYKASAVSHHADVFNPAAPFHPCQKVLLP